MLILTNDFYNVPKHYRFMTKEIFDLLEKSFLEGNEYTDVPENDFIEMTHKTLLNNGIENS